MRILTITHPNMENGLGCRVTMWAAGCNHHCEGCHNQHTWNYDQGAELTDENVENTIFGKLDKPYIKGLTISGGDPLAQNEESLKELNDFILKFRKKFPDKDIWIYSGSTYEEAIADEHKKAIIDNCDIMVDGPFIQCKAELDLAFRGSTNQRIIDLKMTRKLNEIVSIDL